MKLIIKCPTCGVETTNPKFCSVKCRGKYYSGERNICHRPEVKEKFLNNNPMSNPEIKNKHQKIMEEQNKKPEINDKRSKSIKTYWDNNIERKEEQRNKMLGNSFSNNPEVIEKLRIAAIKQWENPEFKAKYGAKPKPIYNCIKCGKETQNEKYCSPKCSGICTNAVGKTRGKHWKTPEEVIKKKSIAMLGVGNHMYGKPAPKGSGRGKGAYHQSPLQGQVWTGSSWERLYAFYLEQNNIPYMYEDKFFHVLMGEKKTTYRPDFRLYPDTEQEEFIDIKGWEQWNKEKIKCFKEQYPSIKLSVLFANDLKQLGIKI